MNIDQRFEHHWHDEAFLRIPHDRLLLRTIVIKTMVFQVQRFDNSVSLMLSRFLKDFVWILHRVLNSPSVRRFVVNKAVAGCFILEIE